MVCRFRAAAPDHAIAHLLEAFPELDQLLRRQQAAGYLLRDALGLSASGLAGRRERDDD